jgi:magnesium transporter
MSEEVNLKSSVAENDLPYAPPPDLVYIGERVATETVVRVFDFETGDLVEKQCQTFEEIEPFLGAAALTWIDWVGLKNISMLSALCEHMDIHPLHIEDLVHIDQHPKVEDTDNYTIVFLRRLYRPAKHEELQSHQISFIITPNELITFREVELGIFDPVRARLRNSRGRIRNMGSDYLAYSLLDTVIDGYFVILAELEDEIEVVQDEILTKPPNNTIMTRLHKIRSDLLIARKSLWPLREAVLALERSPSIRAETEPFIRNAYDHTIKLADSLDFTRDLLNAALECHMTSINNRMNETMRLLTVISVIFMPVTFIAGVYGMNFEFLPETKWHFGYVWFWALIIFVTSLLIFIFRKRKWL